MTRSIQLSRRTVLKGLGTALSLPLLDAMLPITALAGRDATAVPNRMAFLYVPNGMHMPDWLPTTTGADYEMPPILAKLAEHREYLNVLSGLTHDKARANGDGGGDHARALSVFLTGCQPRKTHGADIKVGISADQVAAQRIGHLTRLPSLELGCDRGANAGNCDSGYSCAYSANSSWRSESTPMSKEVDPRLAFERLFGSGRDGESAASRAKREKYKKSILDFVQEDADQLRRQLGAGDLRKMDEYLTSVREIEQRIERAERFATQEVPQPEMAKPNGIPKDYAQHIRLMSDLLALAFQGDLTRIATFVHANEGSNRSYPFIEVPDGHHDLSHHGRDKTKQEKISKINQFHAEQFAYLLGKLKSIREADGCLLDHAMVVYGSAIGDGDAHNHDNLPIVLAGRGCGTIKPGWHLKYPNETPLNNLWLALLDRMGAGIPKLGDSTGLLKDLS